MTEAGRTDPRTIGLLGATGIGVGGIVGGGILALAGTAFATAGPAALVAFAVNGVIAVLTALSFAEMSTAFPESGGTYTFAKKVLSVEAAFGVGWIVWFASIVAAVLYALGFAAYTLLALQQVWPAGAAPGWLGGRAVVVGLAAAATVFYALSLGRGGADGKQWGTIGKLVVFTILIAGGAWTLLARGGSGIRGGLSPFFLHGAGGVLEAMGYTFIALQGFDLIAAVAGEVREPSHVLPRAMLSSLAIALVVYLPLLFLVATAGLLPGESVAQLGGEQAEALVAIAARRFLGGPGYWLVIVAGVLSMATALQANLLAASRVALAMARDRTLPSLLGRLDVRRGTPVAAIVASTAIIVAILCFMRDIAAAGAASSLVFLLSFALVHGTAILARRRGRERPGVFRTPWFPAVPITGGLACAGLAIFQSAAVPSAGLVCLAWLGAGTMLFILLLARRARVVDAAAEAHDPELLQLRGRSPLVLVPIANPANAGAMVAVATALAPPAVGRVLLLSVVTAPGAAGGPALAGPLQRVQDVLGQALTASFAAGLAPEALTTVADRPWDEIARVARIHHCENLLLGLSNIDGGEMGREIERLMSGVDCDVTVLRAQPGWHPAAARRVLVPIGGRGGHDRVRARLLGSLLRTAPREIRFLMVLAGGASETARREAKRRLKRIAEEEVRGAAEIEIAASDTPAEEVTRHAAESDLVILGLRREHRRRKSFGDVALRIARNTDSAIIMISRRG